MSIELINNCQKHYKCNIKRIVIVFVCVCVISIVNLIVLNTRNKIGFNKHFK